MATEDGSRSGNGSTQQPLLLVSARDTSGAEVPSGNEREALAAPETVVEEEGAPLHQSFGLHLWPDTRLPLEVPMQLAHAPLPGNWVINAQAVLDDLARYATFDEVAANYPNPRVITEAVLGYPIAGGCATKRAIRAVGALLQHRLGPAVAVEALSWAASVCEVLDPTSTELFLESAAGTELALRPLRIEDRFTFLGELTCLTTPRARRHKLAEWWERREAWYRPEPMKYWSPADDLECDTCFATLDRSGHGPYDYNDPFRLASLVDRLVRESTGARQLCLYKGAGWDRQRKLAADPRLFGFKPAVVHRCLLDHTGDVLRNPACPGSLADRVRNPYDEATLELAVRAGKRYYNPARVRLILEDRSSPIVASLAERLPFELLAALFATGSLQADDLIDGVLRGIDPAEESKIRRAAMPVNNWTWDRTTRDPIKVVPAWLIDLLMRHPRGDLWTWALEPYAPPASELRALTTARHPAVRKLAVSRLPPQYLVAEDAPIAEAVGGNQAAACPGIAAAARPRGFGIRQPKPYELLDVDEARPGLARRYSYPEEIESLTKAAFEDAPGWSIALPRTSDGLARNARLMQNCTASYDASISAGRGVILIVHSPSGDRYNVSLHSGRRTGEWRVGEINSWDNEGIQPEWLGPALTRWFTRRSWEIQDPFAMAEPCLRNRYRRSRPRRR